MRSVEAGASLRATAGRRVIGAVLVTAGPRTAHPASANAQTHPDELMSAASRASKASRAPSTADLPETLAQVVHLPPMPTPTFCPAQHDHRESSKGDIKQARLVLTGSFVVRAALRQPS